MAYKLSSKAKIARADAERIRARDARVLQIVDGPQMPTTDELRLGFPPYANDLMACIRFWTRHEMRRDDLDDTQRSAFQDVLDHPSQLTMRDLASVCGSSIDWVRRTQYYRAVLGDADLPETSLRCQSLPGGISDLFTDA